MLRCANARDRWLPASWHAALAQAAQQGVSPFQRPFASPQELRSRYRPLKPAACQPLWEKAFEAADATDPKERPGAVARKRRLHILGGAVMRCWGAVQVGNSEGGSRTGRRAGERQQMYGRYALAEAGADH